MAHVHTIAAPAARKTLVTVGELEIAMFTASTTVRAEVLYTRDTDLDAAIVQAQEILDTWQAVSHLPHDVLAARARNAADPLHGMLVDELAYRLTVLTAQ